MASLEFVKTCVTNVRVMDGVGLMRYTVYEYVEDGGGRDGFYSAIRRLREHGAFCIASEDELWAFSTMESELVVQTPELEGAPWRRTVQGSVSSPSDAETATARNVKGLLLDAVEASIAFSLARCDAMSRVGPWQWAHDSTEPDYDVDSSVLTRLHAKVDKSGALVLCSQSCSSTLRRLPDTQASGSVLIAPFGLLANLLSDQIDGIMDHAPRPTPIASSPAWKRLVTMSLACEGIHVDESDEWVTVDFSKDTLGGCALWPMRLCFSLEQSTTASSSLATAEWKRWFDTASTEESETFQNPLRFAEQWFSRTLQGTSADSDDHQLTDLIDDGPNTTELVADTPYITSPPFNQRLADQQAAMYGIYPTPPDGKLPGPIPSQNVVSSDPLNEVLHATGSSQLSNEMDMQASHSDALLLPGTTNAQAGNEDLFGEMSEMDFGANEVGDADFDYFDEPDDIPKSPAGDDEDVEMSRVSTPAKAENADQQETLVDASPIPEQPLESALSPAVEASPETVDAMTGAAPDEEPFKALDQQSLPKKEYANPLSPFNIRERLLPAPVPASMQQPIPRTAKRSRSFAPMEFREGLSLGEKYAAYAQRGDHAIKQQRREAGVHFPQRHKKTNLSPINTEPNGDAVTSTDSSDAESPGDTSNTSDDQERDRPPNLPWEPFKRKSNQSVSRWTTSRPLSSHGQADVNARTSEAHENWMLKALLRLSKRNENDVVEAPLIAPKAEAKASAVSIPGQQSLSSPAALFELSKLDRISIAQIVSEQAVTSTIGLTDSVHRLSERLRHQTATVQNIVDEYIARTLSSTETCPVDKMLLARETIPRGMTGGRNGVPLPNAPTPSRDINSAAPPPLFAVPAPYVRIQRGSDKWDMLPPALSFWGALGLGPANDSKQITVAFMIPDHHDLVQATEDFGEDLRQAYEGCKLGTFSRAKFADAEDGLLRVSVPADEDLDLSSALRAYAAKCRHVGKQLAANYDIFRDRTAVLCMVNPFGADLSAKQALCACFWLLYKTYRDNLTKTSRDRLRGDLVLQIIPLTAIASSDGMVVHEASSMAALATEIYDRCPPSAKAASAPDSSSTLPIMAAPAVELAAVPNRRIAFQLSADPPRDLLQDGSILHVAYAMSSDAQWMCVCWIDSTGHYQRNVALSMRGKSFVDVALEAWEQTLKIVAAREVTWRVLVLSVEKLEFSLIECWRKVATSKARKQMLHVTLASLDHDSMIQLRPAQAPESAKQTAADATTPGGGFLTPVSTPSAAMFTVSPEASGQGNNAPLTPAPSDAATQQADNDPDAVLLDGADESWGMLLSPSFSSTGVADSSSANASNGLLLRRGSSPETEHLQTLSVTLHWEIRLRPNGMVDEGHARQVESSLRELLKMYRNLALLAKLRGLERRSGFTSPTDEKMMMASSTLLPIHALCVSEGAKALNGFV